MDLLASPAGVFIILLVVVIAAFNFQPAGLAGPWKELATLYASDQRPKSIQFPNESIDVGSSKPMNAPAIPGFDSMNIALDEDGFWLLSTKDALENASVCLFLPWDCVRYRQTKGERQNFQMRGKDPIELWVSNELGDAMQRRAMRFEIEDQL